MKKAEYEKALHLLQIELVKLQRHIISENRRILIIFEGRDASGKDGVIKRITQHLSPRETRVVALGKPTERENRAWYFQRYVHHLPVDGELVLFNRSWYNRAGVEKVMGYCNQAEYDNFMDTVNEFEDLLVRSGIKLIKYYLNISRDEQKKRLTERKKSPLKQWKISPVDESALKNWGAYSKAHSEMIQRTHSKSSPWYIIHTDNKKQARLNVIRHMLYKLDNPDKDLQLCVPDKDIVLPYRDSLPIDDIINA